MTTQTVTRPESDQTVEKKIQRLRELYATGPEAGKTALEKVLGELTSFASTTRARVESAGRTGIRQGKVSELLFITPFAPGGAERLRALLQLRDGSFDDTDRVGTVHDMRFVFLDNDTKLLFATAYDGEWDPYIDDFATKITDQMDVIFTACEGWPGIRSPKVKDWIVDHQIPAGQVVSVAGQTGEYAPLHCTAHGKALLADCDRCALTDLLGGAPLHVYSRRTVKSVTRLARVCAQVRRDGFALDDGEYIEEVRCLAAPIRDPHGEIIGSVGISSPVTRLPTRAIARAAAEVKKTAAAISASLAG